MVLRVVLQFIATLQVSLQVIKIRVSLWTQLTGEGSNPCKPHGMFFHFATTWKTSATLRADIRPPPAPLSHTVHLWGFYPVWMRLCFCSSEEGAPQEGEPPSGMLSLHVTPVVCSVLLLWVSSSDGHVASCFPVSSASSGCLWFSNVCVLDFPSFTLVSCSDGVSDNEEFHCSEGDSSVWKQIKKQEIY